MLCFLVSVQPWPSDGSVGVLFGMQIFQSFQVFFWWVFLLFGFLLLLLFCVVVVLWLLDFFW